jgi:hypothetical protein
VINLYVSKLNRPVRIQLSDQIAVNDIPALVPRGEKIARLFEQQFGFSGHSARRIPRHKAHPDSVE